MKKTEYDKLRTKVLGVIEGLTLLDDRYFNVRHALVYAEGVHSNTRKDGSREFSHQLEMLSLAISLHKSLLKPYEVYMAIIVHDTIEDYPERSEELHQMFPDIVGYSRKLSKFIDPADSGEPKTYFQYFSVISNCEVCSIVKLIDRIHNLSTAPGVFSTDKLTEYCIEVDNYFIEMTRTAKGQFNQREAYEILKTILGIEVRTIRTFLSLLLEQERTLKTPQQVLEIIGKKHQDGI